MVCTESSGSITSASVLPNAARFGGQTEFTPSSCPLVGNKPLSKSTRSAPSCNTPHRASDVYVTHVRERYIIFTIVRPVLGCHLSRDADPKRFVRIVPTSSRPRFDFSKPQKDAKRCTFFGLHFFATVRLLTNLADQEAWHAYIFYRASSFFLPPPSQLRR